MAAVDNRRTDTRDRVLSVALDLFAERGYQETSLREIAERLGVTKAALYFHFKTKQEILTALLAGYAEEVAGMAASAAGPADLLSRYAALQERWGFGFVLLVRQNYAEIRDLPVGAAVQEATQALIRALAPAGAGPKERLRVRLALTTFQVAAAVDGDERITPADALALAVEILRG